LIGSEFARPVEEKDADMVGQFGKIERRNGFGIEEDETKVWVTLVLENVFDALLAKEDGLWQNRKHALHVALEHSERHERDRLGDRVPVQLHPLFTTQKKN